MKRDAKRTWMTYQSQLLQDGLLNTALFEVDSRAVDHLFDDRLVDVSHSLVRHDGSTARPTRTSLG